MLTTLQIKSAKLAELANKLADDRVAHAESRKLVAKGIHPVPARRDERESRARAELHRDKGSFGAVCVDWNAATGADLRPATVLQRNREIEKDLTPRFKDRPIFKITRLELTTALKAVMARAPEVAPNVCNYLLGVFEYAIDSGLIADNPVPPVRVLRKRNQENHPALSPDLLSEFLRKLVVQEPASQKAPPCSNASCEFLAFRFERRSEEAPGNRVGTNNHSSHTGGCNPGGRQSARSYG